MTHRTLTAACGLALQGLLTAAQAQSPAPAPTTTLQEVTVLGGQLTQKAFDTPAAVQHIDARAIQEAGPRINLSEALAQVPGVVALNRNNYAQDVQISIRGFGARAAFGLRGIRLITDGIPATTPDGQGQASTVALGSAARMEVLSGPLAQLYGNASGGVIQTFTREAGAQPQLDVSSTWGSYGLQRHDVQLSGRVGAASQVGVVVDYSLFDTEGYRSNSAASRKHFNSVITSDLSADTRLRVIANVFDMPEAQDPLGLTQAQWQADPRQAGNRALLNNARKSVQQSQLGLVLEHRIHADLKTQWRVYSGTRQNLQYQAGRAHSRWLRVPGCRWTASSPGWADNSKAAGATPWAALNGWAAWTWTALKNCAKAAPPPAGKSQAGPPAVKPTWPATPTPTPSSTGTFWMRKATTPTASRQA
jgi:iron complex outermembrane recepter protein